MTYSFWLQAAGTDRDRLVFVIGSVRRLDRRIANPAYGVLLITGILMILTGAYSFQTGWIDAAIVLYVGVAIIGAAAFGPAIRRQLAEATRDPGSPEYAAAARTASRLGLLTTGIVLVIIVLMVAKPS